AGADKPSQPLDVEAEALRPGLVAHYRVPGADVALARVEPKPAFYLGRSSPHPRIPPGPFEVAWTGLLILKDPGPLSFDAYLGGEVRVEIAGPAVLQGRGEQDTAQAKSREPVKPDPGNYPLQLRYGALPG